MTADNAFVTFTAISVAAAMLALLIGSGGLGLRRLSAVLEYVGPELPSHRKRRLAKLEEMTRVADRAMAARERGERPAPTQYH